VTLLNETPLSDIEGRRTTNFLWGNGENHFVVGMNQEFVLFREKDPRAARELKKEGGRVPVPLWILSHRKGSKREKNNDNTL